MDQNNNGNNQNENRRYIGKVKEQSGQYGNFKKILLDNPEPTNADGTRNQYYKGSLVWIDATTGKKYMVKQLSLKGVAPHAAQRGFVNSISIDLDNDYEVKKLD